MVAWNVDARPIRAGQLMSLWPTAAGIRAQPKGTMQPGTEENDQ